MSDRAWPQPEDAVEPRSWRLKGVGMYGSDVDVVSLDEYRDLAHLQRTTQEALLRWAKRCHEIERRLARAVEVGERMHAMIEQTEGLTPDCQADWDDFMADEMCSAIEDVGGDE